MAKRDEERETVIPDELKKAVVTVGKGRGFIVENGHDRVVITAAHCLPHFPPCHGASYTQERTYANLLGRLDDPSPDVWTECLFADPVADIAVLGCPDGQVLFDEAEAYCALTNDMPVLVIAEAVENAPGWLLPLDGNWMRCIVQHCSGPLWIDDAQCSIDGGMSGSPILNEDGLAIGVVCVSSGGPDLESQSAGGPNPRQPQSSEHRRHLRHRGSRGNAGAGAGAGGGSALSS